MRNKIIIMAGAALSLALTLTAMQSFGMKSEPGLPVNKIAFADSIDDWQAIDNSHLLVRMSPSKNYLLTLRNGCPGLSLSRHVGITSSNNTIYAGFDYVTADGRRCGIQSISRLNRDEVKTLTEI